MNSSKKWLLIVVLCGSLVLASTGCSAGQAREQVAAAEESSAPAVIADTGNDEAIQPFNGVLTVYSAEPVFQSGLDRTWDQSVVDVGAVAYYDGLFHLFYNGSQFYSVNRGFGYNVAYQKSSVGYAVSVDGYEWYRMDDAPILTLEGSGLNIFNARVTSVVILDDGTWVMYLYSQDNDNAGPPSAILRASAPAPEGPWHFDESPVLEPGGTRTWDGYAVRFPEVFKTDDGFVMYYVGVNDQIDFGRGMGMATSNDGISWTKYDDVTTSDGKFRESDPVFLFDELAWGQYSFKIQRVWRTTQEWEMIFSASADYFTTPMFGYATSPDGITWSNFGDTPILMPEQVHGVVGLGFADMLYHNGKYYMYFNASKDEFTGDIYLATAE